MPEKRKKPVLCEFQSRHSAINKQNACSPFPRVFQNRMPLDFSHITCLFVWFVFKVVIQFHVPLQVIAFF